MTLPTGVDDILPHFQKLLSDGKEHRSDEIFEALAQQFRLTSQERDERNANGGLRFQNLIAWCKAYCTMAEFTELGDEDTLCLTPAGKEANSKNPRWTVIYLKSFKD